MSHESRQWCVQAIRSLKLPAGATLRECAQQRNEYTRRRLRQDFQQGLRELAEQAGDATFDQAAFELPVFTVSSLEYQATRHVTSLPGGPPRDQPTGRPAT